MPRRLSIVFVALVLAVGAAGCGGGGSSDTSTTTTTETVTQGTSSETTTGETTTTSASSTGNTFNWASKDCQNLVKAYVGLSAAVGAASGGQDVSGDIQAFAKYANEVPDAIKADVQTLAAAYGTFADKIKAIGYQPGQVPTADQLKKLETASASLGDPKVKAASDNLSAWTTKNCSK